MHYMTRYSQYTLGTIASAFAGCTIAWMLFPTEMLLGLSSYWDAIHGDNATSLIGFYAFAQDEWRWPLLHTRTINPPNGVNIYFTDSVPIAAIVGKILYKSTGVIFPYIGPWILFCYIVSAGVSFHIFLQLKIPLLSAFLASILMVLLPAFLLRYIHIGLTAQFTIIISILAYIRFTSRSSRLEVIMWTALTGLFVFLNPYLLAMSSAMIFAGLFDAWHRKRISAPIVALSLAFLALTVIGSAFACGLIGSDTPLPRVGGFGIYSMNLLSPIVPQFSSFSSRQSFLDYTGGQYEGFNYLGAGVILLTVISAGLGRGYIFGAIRSRPFVGIVVFVLITYAASDVIYLGSIQIASLHYHELPIIGMITSIFRGSGRFFWPVGFLIVIFSVWALSRSVTRANLSTILMAIICIQLFDLRPFFDYLRSNTVTGISYYEKETLTSTISKFEEVLFYPGFFCGSREDFDRVLEIQLISAKLNKPFNGAYINRGNPECEANNRAFQIDPLFASVTNNPLLVIMKQSLSFSATLALVSRTLDCRDDGDTIFCGGRPLDRELEGLGSPLIAPDSKNGNALY